MTDALELDHHVETLRRLKRLGLAPKPEGYVHRTGIYGPRGREQRALEQHGVRRRRKRVPQQGEGHARHRTT
jgi:hypothetical protein